MQLSSSSRTIYSTLKGSGIGHWIARKRPKLEPEHAQKRYEFAVAHADWDVEKWNQVIFTDECSIELGSGKRRRWVLPT
jgi:hypothetical protein